MKKYKKGFTLIELLVVMSIIGILSTTLTLKLRESVAKAKDCKAVAVLGVARITAEIIFIDQIVQDASINSGAITSGALSLKGIFSKLNKETQSVYNYGIDPGYIKIGGSREGKDGKIVYGGLIGLVYPEVEDDSIQLKFYEKARVGNVHYGTRSTRGIKWVAY